MLAASGPPPRPTLVGAHSMLCLCACQPECPSGRLPPHPFPHLTRSLAACLPHRPPPPPAGAAPNQALLLAGYSTEKVNQEYWLAKNSFGASWGERGFARIAMSADGDGQGGMYRTAAVQPTAVAPAVPTKPGAATARP